MDLDAETVKLFQEIILDFWEENGRRNLPWRQTTDPWLILLAETLLRKTTSRQAVSVYEKMAALSPQQIAHLSESRFEEMLRPLGMHRIRTKQIRLLAAAAAEAEADDFQNPEFLASLPGVGRYISSAVLCFAFGRPKPALDTNMIRVLQRVFGVASKRSRPREDPDLWRTAEMLVPSGRCREFNWGVLDLASSLCRPRRPRCPECRLNRICRFYKEAESGAAL